MALTATKRTPGARPTKPTKRTKALTRRKNCYFCLNRDVDPDYKDTSRLRRYISERNRIVPQSKTRTCAKHQRAISTAIRRARTMALLP
jgi:small subunit ribosomal protein S18